jgi:predicted O-linked N-acetylglucosamine transferase (SPINDLY family)
VLQVLASGGVWRDVGSLPEAALAQRIRQDEIDILVELTGRCLEADITEVCPYFYAKDQVAGQSSVC